MTYPNGHKQWLEEHQDHWSTFVRAICHGALYIGRVLEMTAWSVGREAATRPKPPDWWVAAHPNPEGMAGDEE